MGWHKTKNGYGGDEAFQVVEFAISHLILLWEAHHLRRPTFLELQDVFRICLENSLDNEYIELENIENDEDIGDVILNHESYSGGAHPYGCVDNEDD